MNLVRIYDEFAASYHSNRGLFDMTEVFDTFYQGFDTKPGAALDLGCGAGEPFAATFLKHGWSVVGVDFSAKMLELAGHYASGMTAIEADMREVEFAAEQFDAVTIIYALFHIPTCDQKAVLEKVFHWLKPGGRALFTYAGEQYTGSLEFDGHKEFMGRQLYYGHKSAAALRIDLTHIGFDIEAEVYRDIGGEVFLWVTVSKPSPAGILPER